MTKVVLYIATSQDGFIADQEGSIDWLSSMADIQDCGYCAFYQSVDALAMGSHTYEQTLSFGEWPYLNKPTYVFTKRLLQSPIKEVYFVTIKVEEFLQKIKTKIARLWLVGGAELLDSFNQLGKIDEVIITKFPILLGEGLPLGLNLDEWKKDQIINYEEGVVQEYYTKSPSTHA